MRGKRAKELRRAVKEAASQRMRELIDRHPEMSEAQRQRIFSRWCDMAYRALKRNLKREST